MHWLLNVITGSQNEPQAILIRGLHDCQGPGRLTKKLALNGDLYGEDLSISERLWIEKGASLPFKVGPRIGVEYAGEYWKNMPWHYFVGSGVALTLPKKNS